MEARRSGGVEEWRSRGVEDQRSRGVEDSSTPPLLCSSTVLLLYSPTPLLLHSSTPPLLYSSTPPLLHSSTPPLPTPSSHTRTPRRYGLEVLTCALHLAGAGQTFLSTYQKSKVLYIIPLMRGRGARTCCARTLSAEHL